MIEILSGAEDREAGTLEIFWMRSIHNYLNQPNISMHNAYG